MTGQDHSHREPRCCLSVSLALHSPAITGGAACGGAELGDLLPHLGSVIVDKIETTPSAVLFMARYWPAAAACPACGTWSSRVHSGYVRHVRDLPLGGRPVLIRLAMRRFLCTNPACPKVTFAGQADGLTARYQRWSVPLAGLLTQVAPGAGRAGRDAARRRAGYRGAPRHPAAAGHRPARPSAQRSARGGRRR